MNRVLRACLLWVMVIAMPVQAMAATMMLFCGPSHARMVQGLMPGMSDHAATAASHGAHMAHAHAEGHEHDTAPPLEGPQADALGGANTTTAATASAAGDVSCSACAACASVLAPPARAVLPGAPDGVLPALRAAPMPPQSHQPDGLDRPPRTPIA